MKKSEIHILVVEDDGTQGKAIAEALQRAGYRSTLTNSGPKGLELSRNQEFHAILADCMLPKMNGVDLLIEIRHQSPVSPKLFLMSGIFKDRGFITSSLDKTGALAFFAKPLDLGDLIGHFDQAFVDAGPETETPALVGLYAEHQLSSADVLTLIESEATLAALHVPMLLKRLQATDLTGELEIVFEGGAQHSVAIFEGRIGSVRTPDKETYFGALAVGLGFVSPEEVLETLNTPSTKMLGQRLIDSMLLSPHAIALILEEQLALRLSQTIGSGLVSVRWTPKTLPKPDYGLQAHRFATLMGDWTRSKMDAQGLRPLFANWGAFKLQGHYHPDIADASTLDDLFANPEFTESSDLPYLFRQLLDGNATLGERGEETRSFSFLENRLAQLLEDHKQQTYYQVLGVSEKAHHLEINRAMNDLRLHFDPQALPAHAPAALRAKTAKVFGHIELAHRTLLNDESRAEYMSLLSKKRSQEFLEHEPRFRQAVLDLQNDNAAEAMAALETIMARKIEFKDVRAYYLWAGLKVHQKQFKGLTLEQVPPEERHSAPYHVAKGIWHRQHGQVTKALECFRTANVLDPRLNSAKIEIQNLRGEGEVRTSGTQILRDATSVMDGILGGRKRGA